jgi:uncharacterized protein (DUF305 family)
MATALPDLRRSPRLGGALLAAAAIGAIVMALIGARRATPRDASAEAGFARDMATHHAQAVEMAFVIRDKSSDAALRALAYDIIVTQSTQRGVLMGWLQQWGLPQASRAPRMAWMPGHAQMEQDSGGRPLMHGMATDDELRRLRQAGSADAEVLFLQLMIRHHEGGVIMAEAVENLSRRPEVVGMARSIVNSQRVEIAAMTEMLEQRGITAAGPR